MASFPSTFRSEFTATDSGSYGSLSASYKELRNPDSDTESRLQDAQGGRYLDLDLDYTLDDGGTKKPPSGGSSNSSNTLIVGSAELSDSKVSKDTGTGDRSTYQMESPDQQDDNIEFFKTRRKLSCADKLIKFVMLTVAFIFEFLLLYFDCVLDFVLGGLYFWYEEIALGVFTWLFPILAGIICTVELPKLLNEHKNTYCDFKSNFCNVLSKIPTFQPVMFSFYVFKTEVRYYPLNLRYSPHVADLQQVSRRLNILQAAFQATPQALLQMFVYVVGCKSLQNEDVALFLIGLKIVLSLVSMSRLCVRYWQAYTPFIYIPDIDQRPDQNLQIKKGGCCGKFWKQLANYCLQLPYYWEGLTLSWLRVITLVLALPMLIQLLKSPITLDIIQPPVYLIPIILLGILLVTPRLIHSTLLWSRCQFSRNLKQQWVKYEISDNEQGNQKSEYFSELFKRSLYSILVYPIYPCSVFLIFYINLEILVVFIYYVHHEGSKLPAINWYTISGLLITYYCSVIIRILYEKLILSKPKSRYLLPQRIVKKCENIIQKLESENPLSFVLMKKNILDFTEFYFQRVIGKKFITTRGIQKYLDDKEQILEMFTLPWNCKSRSALVKEYPVKIGENGTRLVLKKLPLWNYINYFCCQVLVYYSVKHRDVFEKFELFQNLKRLHKFKTVQFNNMTEEEREVLLSFVDILQPLSYICLINFHTSPTFNYTAIQNFTHFEVPLGNTAMRDVDTDKLAYILESVVAAKKKDWNLSNLNNLHLEAYPKEDEIEFEPLVYENIPFMDAQL